MPIMNSKPLLALLALLFAASPACDRGAPPKAEDRSGAPAGPAAPGDAAEAAGHGKAGARPGSHEDWCGEHEVPESLCTRCNPALVPAFEATGDWCEEHGLPESQCLACNPDLKIERPPAQAGER